MVQSTPQPFGTPETPDRDRAPNMMTEEPGGDQRRTEAVKRLEKKRGWQAGMVAYVVVNAFLIGIWFMTGRGYFWPAWPLGAWGLGMVLSFWDLYVRRPITEDDIQAEVRRG